MVETAMMILREELQPMGERTTALFCAVILALFLISFAGAAALAADGIPLPAVELSMAPSV